MSAAPNVVRRHRYPSGHRRYRECVTPTCRRGFYGAYDRCSDCRAGTRPSQLLYRAMVADVGRPGVRRRRRKILEQLLGVQREIA